MLSTAWVLAQDSKYLAININVENSESWRTLKPEISNGSGQYIYVWKSSAPYGISSDRSLKNAVVPQDEEDITYEVFVRDQKSGLLGYSSINFSHRANTSGLRVYPNPAKSEISLSLTSQQESLSGNEQIVKAEVYSEKNSQKIKSIDVAESESKELRINVRGIEPGVYFVHLYIRDKKTTNEQRKIVRVLIN
jgi:hypothetical protein